MFGNKNLLKMLPSKRFVLSSVLPCLGCGWQLYYIITAFMEYNSVTEINRLLYGHFKPPILELCVPWASSQHNYSRLNIQETWSRREKFPTARSRVEKFKPFQEIGVFVNVSQPKAAGHDFNEFFTSSRYFKDRKACFTIEYKDLDFHYYNNQSTAEN